MEGGNWKVSGQWKILKLLEKRKDSWFKCVFPSYESKWAMRYLETSSPWVARIQCPPPGMILTFVFPAKSFCVCVCERERGGEKMRQEGQAGSGVSIRDQSSASSLLSLISKSSKSDNSHSLVSKGTTSSLSPQTIWILSPKFWQTSFITLACPKIGPKDSELKKE